MVLGSYGEPINGQKDDVITLKYPLEDTGEDRVMWSRTYEDVILENGVFNMVLSGDDDREVSLVAGMFDEEGVKITVEVDTSEVELALMSQPYAIKARISDESHSTKALQRVEIEEVSELNDGDILVVKDGKWVNSANKINAYIGRQ